MWRKLLIVSLTVFSCAAIPRGSRNDVLHRLVRLPKTQFPAPLIFDRTSGFVVFPNESGAVAEAAELLQDVKGAPADAPLFLAAGRVLARADLASAIRSYARAAELFERKTELETGDVGAWIGLSDACLALGRFAEAQAALDKAETLDAARTELARARFHKEKAWSLFAGEENRFTTVPVLDIIERIVAAKSGVRIDAAKQELQLAAGVYQKKSDRSAKDVALLQERANFASFSAVLQAAFSQLQGGERSPRTLRHSIFTQEALNDLAQIAELQPGGAQSIALAAFVRVVAEQDDKFSDSFSAETRAYLLSSCRRLESIAESGSKQSGEAAELLGAARLFLLRDSSGSERSARVALHVQPAREASWDLLALSLISAGKNAELAELCEDRVTRLPSARSSALLIKAYALQGAETQAEWNGLLAAGLYPNDFDVNLTLAALLLQRDNYTELLWRAGDALNKAEKQLSGVQRQSRLDFVLLKSIFLGLSDKPEQARTLLAPYTRENSTLELQELISALD